MLGINTWIGLNLYTNNVLELTRNAGSSTPDRYTAVLHSPSLVIRRHETIQKKGIEVINSADSPIEMSIEYALEQFESHGWAEAVLLAVSKAIGQNCDCIPHIASGLAVGLGGLGEVCGAVSGGVLAMGLLYGQDYSVGPKTREYVHRFAEQNGAVRCIDLLGLDESSVEVILAFARNHKKEVCDGLVSSAVQILLELFGGFGQLEEAAGL